VWTMVASPTWLDMLLHLPNTTTALQQPHESTHKRHGCTCCVGGLNNPKSHVVAAFEPAVEKSSFEEAEELQEIIDDHLPAVEGCSACAGHEERVEKHLLCATKGASSRCAILAIETAFEFPKVALDVHSKCATVNIKGEMTPCVHHLSSALCDIVEAALLHCGRFAQARHHECWLQTKPP